MFAGIYFRGCKVATIGVAYFWELAAMLHRACTHYWFGSLLVALASTMTCAQILKKSQITLVFTLQIWQCHPPLFRFEMLRLTSQQCELHHCHHHWTLLARPRPGVAEVSFYPLLSTSFLKLSFSNAYLLLLQNLVFLTSLRQLIGKAFLACVDAIFATREALLTHSWRGQAFSMFLRYWIDSVALPILLKQLHSIQLA